MPRPGMNTLDRLERLARTYVQNYSDLEDWASEVRMALPALIRVASAAGRVYAANRSGAPEGDWQAEYVAASREFDEALQQLRELHSRTGGCDPSGPQAAANYPVREDE